MKSIAVFAALFCAVVCCLADPQACGDNLYWEVKSGVLTFTGYGDMIQYSTSDRPGWDGQTYSSVLFDNSAECTIGEYAFYNDEQVTSVTAKGLIASVDDYAFNGATNLAQVTLKAEMDHLYLGRSAFEGCSKLGQVTISGSQVVKLNQPYTFDSCGNVTLNIEGTINTGISNYGVFNGCEHVDISFHGWNSTNQGSFTFDSFCVINQLRSLSISGQVEGSFDNMAGCSDLETLSVSGFDGTIESSAFHDLHSLKTVTIKAVNLSKIGSSAFDYNDGLEKVEIYGMDGPIGDYAFRGCTELSDLIIDGAKTSIGEYAFNDCAKLKNFSFSHACESIGAYAFGGCSEIKNLIIPASVTDIENYAFSGCQSLDIVYYQGERDPGESADDAFDGCPRVERVLVPMTYKTKYFCGKFAKKIQTAGAISNSGFFVRGIMFAAMALCLVLGQW